jgi:hypothetical protein
VQENATTYALIVHGTVQAIALTFSHLLGTKTPRVRNSSQQAIVIGAVLAISTTCTVNARAAYAPSANASDFAN